MATSSILFKKNSIQVVKKQNLALPPVQDVKNIEIVYKSLTFYVISIVKNIWDYSFTKALGTTVNDKSGSESLLQGQFFERPDMVYYTTSPQDDPLKGFKAS